MKNLSCSEDYGKEKEIVRDPVNEVVDNRVFITYCNDGTVGYFLQSGGRALVFRDTAAAEAYLERNELETPMIEPVTDHGLTDDDMLEV